MKVLMVSNFRDGTGYSRAGMDLCLAMDSVGIDIVPRTIHFNNRNLPVSLRFEELESKSAAGCNINIQHVLPHLFCYNGNFDRNICLFASETSHFKDSTWPERLNLADDVWCINREQHITCTYSGIAKPIHVVPHATDLSQYEITSKLPLPIPETDFVFVFCGEFVRRKNLADLIKAFHVEFDPNENVQLLIKTTLPNVSPEQIRAEVEKFCSEIKKGLKLWREENIYKKELIITDFLSPQQMLELYNSCHCFVSASRGEAWNLPMMDAIGMGLPVIGSATGGHITQIDNKCGTLVGGIDEPCFGALDSFADLYTARSEWFQVDVTELMTAMRGMYNIWQSDAYTSMKQACRKQIKNFSYEKVGTLIKNILETKNVNV